MRVNRKSILWCYIDSKYHTGYMVTLWKVTTGPIMYGGVKVQMESSFEDLPKKIFSFDFRLNGYKSVRRLVFARAE